MKTFCRYLLIDIQTGFALCAGEKYKDFNNSTMRYINNGTFRFGLFRRKIIEYFRTLEVKGRECVIVYWLNAPAVKEISFAYLFNNRYYLREKGYFPKEFFCGNIVGRLGVDYENY